MKNQKRTEYSLHAIKEIKTIEELSKHYDLIYKHAIMVTKYNNKSDAKDLVQDFFLRMDGYFKKSPNKSINGGFIATSLKNRFIDEKRYMRRFDFGVGDKDSVETYLEDYKEENYEMDIDDERLEKLHHIVQNNLTEEERRLITLTFDMNLSELSRQTGISYSNLRYEYLRIKNKIEKLIK